MNDPQTVGATIPDGQPVDADARLSTIMGELARSLDRDHSDVDGTFSGICEAAREGVPGAEDAGITLRHSRNEFSSHGATSEIPGLIDKVQEKLQQGPCVDAARDADVVHVRDMTTETRWPSFTPAAADAGVRSMLSFQLWVEDSHLGALNLYSTKVDAFDESSTDIGRPLAAHASVALASARREDQLRSALDSRDIIGQAKGMLMQRYSISADEAFDLIKRLSQESNVKARDIAERITQGGLE